MKSLWSKICGFADVHPLVVASLFAAAVTLTVTVNTYLHTARVEVPAAEARYVARTGRIVGRPIYAKDGQASLTQALVRAPGGAEAVVAVDEQSARGDRWTVWVDTTNGRLWRTDTAGSTPIPDPAEQAALGFVLGLAVAAFTTVAAFAVFLFVDSHDLSPRRLVRTLRRLARPGATAR